MRDLKVVGLDVTGRNVICEIDQPDDGSDKFRLPLNEQLRAAVRGDQSKAGQTAIDIEPNRLRPRDIQARIRAGASVEQLSAQCGGDIHRIQRFADPVLLERARAAELATAAHPILDDGPSVLSLLETVTGTLIGRGLNPENLVWDAWRNEDSRWTVQLAWQAGRSENVAHFRYAPGSHGGTVSAIDNTAAELIDPSSARPLRPVAAVAQLDFGSQPSAAARVSGPAVSGPAPKVPVAQAPVGQMSAPKAPAAQREDPAAPKPAAAAHAAPAEPEPEAPKQRTRGRAHPTVPGWEDVLLGVRSGSER